LLPESLLCCSSSTFSLVRSPSSLGMAPAQNSIAAKQKVRKRCKSRFREHRSRLLELVRYLLLDPAKLPCSDSFTFRPHPAAGRLWLPPVPPPLQQQVRR
ncbi:unnamed protein product, partial [Ectocarpus sp. 4 AP-2014]